MKNAARRNWLSIAADGASVVRQHSRYVKSGYVHLVDCCLL